LEQVAGTGGASLAVALGVTVLVAAGAALAWRPGRGTWAALALAAATLGVGAVAAASFDRGLSARVVRTSLGPDPAWISRSGLENVDVLQTPFSNRLQISDQLFWNPNLTRILRMKDASEVDVYGSVPTRIARDGRIVAAGRVVRGPILVQEYASAVAVEDATLVGRHVSHSLWRPAGTPRIASLFAGRYLDGLMGPYARITVWPRGATARRTTLTVRFRLPADVPATTLEARGPGGVRVLPLAPDRWTTLVVPIAAIDGPVTVALRARRPFLGTDGRLLGARATRPVLVDHVPERSSRAPSVPITRS
jgi:hypothetical protein